MNVSVEVESGLKQLKNGGEVVIDKLKVKRVSIADSLKSKFVYNVGGYHHTPIPSQLQPKLGFAHPSPLVRLFQSKISTLTIDNLLLGLSKLTLYIRYVYNSVLCRLSIQTVHICNNLNNECNLQSINNENRLYDNRLNNYTYNNMILMNITKI